MNRGFCKKYTYTKRRFLLRLYISPPSRSDRVFHIDIFCGENGGMARTLEGVQGGQQTILSGATIYRKKRRAL